VATALLEANADVRIKLLYANQSPDDILCQQELDAIAADARVSVWYTVDRVAEGAAWPYSTGFISEDMLREHMPVADEHTCIFMCAPAA
jgi:NAD(P)H-flavin reductase